MKAMLHRASGHLFAFVIPECVDVIQGLRPAPYTQFAAGSQRLGQIPLSCLNRIGKRKTLR